MWRRLPFRLQVILCWLAAVAALLAAFRAWQLSFWVTCGLLALAGILCIAAGLRLVTRTQRDLAQLLEALRTQDFTLHFPDEVRSGRQQVLYQAFNGIIGALRQLKAEKAAHFHYLQTVVDHVGVALLCIDAGGQIRLANRAALDLLQRPHLGSLQGLALVSEELYSSVLSIRSGRQDLIRILVRDRLLNLAIRATEFTLQGEQFKLVSLQDIRNELDANELDAWQKLIRVLTHEIMNSVTPVISLSRSLQPLVHEWPGDQTEEIRDDLRQGLRTIEHRSEGLLQFVHAYRSLTRLPEPQFGHAPVLPLLEETVRLFEAEAAGRGIRTRIQATPPELEALMDARLIGQALINLYKNALEAAGEGGEIRLEAHRAGDTRVQIHVIDDGPGIPPELWDKILIPFFTTKPQGSGIGLSLSRQIVQMHRGELTFTSIPEQETRFTMVI
ncbi:MAG: ATP-binding protein [Bacteroidia bacterium]|nr:ATP-binding protein [Bacteroidia bacterium]